MNRQEQFAITIEAQNAQQTAQKTVGDGERGVTVGQLKEELLRHEGGSDTDIKFGLEIERDDGAAPRPMEQIDSGWSDFVERQEMEAEVSADGWMAAAAANEELAVARANEALDTLDDEQVLNSALTLASTAPERYGEYLDELAGYDPEYAQGVAVAVSHTLNEVAANDRALEFAEELRLSEEANTALAERAIAAAAAARGMSAADVEKASRAYLQAVGRPLRLDLLSVDPHQREAYVNEVAVAHQLDERVDREMAFKAAFFSGGTDISRGLTINGRPANPDLPPSIMDRDYAAYRTERSIRAEDARRQDRAEVQSAEAIKRGLLNTPDEKDWRQALTDQNGRPLSLQEIYEADPDSVTNVQARERQRQAMKIQSLAGGRLT